MENKYSQFEEVTKENNAMVYNHITDYFKRHLPQYDVLHAVRKSKYDCDNYLYMVVGYTKSKESYGCWTCWNEDTLCLNNGHYMLNTEEDAIDLLKRYHNPAIDLLNEKFEMEIKTIKEWADSGVHSAKNEYGEIRTTYYNDNDKTASIVFNNGWVASVIRPPKTPEEWSVAVCDLNGYFNWEFLKPFGNDDGTITCDTEKQVCKVIEIISLLKPVSID